MTHNILFVDDEENILKALKRLLHRSPYTLFFAQGGREALEIIKGNEISVLVSDMRMPEMNGVELIKEANIISPSTMKIILSGYSDIDDIMAAVNSGHVHSYITKPWNEAELMISLLNASELYERRVSEKRLLKQLEEKNDELEILNESLDRRVKERTWELNASNRVLNMIIEGQEDRVIFLQIVSLITKVAEGRPVAIWIEGEGRFTGANFIEVDSPLHKRSLEKRTNILIEGSLVIPLLKGEDYLGTVFIGGVEKEEAGFLRRLEGLLSVLRLYLTQRAYIQDSEALIGSIDSILGRMDDERT